MKADALDDVEDREQSSDPDHWPGDGSITNDVPKKLKVCGRGSHKIIRDFRRPDST